MALPIVHSHHTKNEILQFLKTDNLTISVTEFGMDDFKFQTYIERSISTCYGIHFILRDNGTYNVSNRKFDAKENDAIISFPSTHYSLSADAEKPWKYFWILFNGPFAEQIVSDAKFTLQNPVYSVQNHKEIATLIKKLLNTRGVSDEIYLLKALSTLCEIFAIITLERQIDKSSNCLNSDDFIKKAINLIETNYMNPDYKITSICSDLHISHSYLCQLFKKNLNSSADQYLTNYRIRMAGILLNEGKLNVEEVAYAVGYTNSSYFIKRFTQIIGKTPKQYRTIMASKRQ